MILSDKRITQLVKKLSGKAPAKREVKDIKETPEENIRTTSADDIFREMKKLPYSS